MHRPSSRFDLRSERRYFRAWIHIRGVKHLMKGRLHVGAITFLFSAFLTTSDSYAQNELNREEENPSKQMETLWQAADLPPARRTESRDTFLDLLNSISIFRSGGSLKNNEEPQDQTGVFDESYWDEAVYR